MKPTRPRSVFQSYKQWGVTEVNIAFSSQQRNENIVQNDLTHTPDY